MKRVESYRYASYRGRTRMFVEPSGKRPRNRRETVGMARWWGALALLCAPGADSLSPPARGGGLQSGASSLSLSGRALPLASVPPPVRRAAAMLATEESEAVETCRPVGTCKPMRLPELGEAQLSRLAQGERVSTQQPPAKGGEGFGWSVQDVCLSPDVAFSMVRDFEGYVERIKTVRRVEQYTSEVEGQQHTPCYSILVSRIRLVMNVRFDIDEAAR